MGGKFFHNCIKGFACLAMALLVMANKPCFAVDNSDVPTFGAFDVTLSPLRMEYDSSWNLYDFLSHSMESRSDLPFTYSDLYSVISSSSLHTIFENYSVYNGYFCDLYLYKETSSSFYIVVNFYKYGLDDSVSVSSHTDYLRFYSDIQSVNFPEFYTISYPYAPYNATYPSDFGFPLCYLESVSAFPTYSSNISINASRVVPFILSNNFSNVFDLFLSDDFYFASCILHFSDSLVLDSTMSGISLNCSVSVPWNLKRVNYPIFSMRTTYKNLSFTAGSFATSNLFPSYIARCYFATVPSFSNIFSYGIILPSEPPTPSPMPTPTGIPHWRDDELPSPTPYPSVSLAPLPTGIVTDFIPLLDLPSSENTLSNITGIIKEFNSIFSRKVFALGSYVLQVMYYFSGWFKFIFLVPAGVFIAFLIGRLRKK